MFSIATNIIESEMIGSTTSPGRTTIFFMLNASVIECAMVNAVACHRIVLISFASRQIPMINKI
jgi:hypothetical protein